MNDDDSFHGFLYALLDSAGEAVVYDKALFYEDRFKPLLEEEEFETVSPYLIELHDDEIMQWLLDEFDQANWILFLKSTKEYGEMLSALKQFVKMHDEESGEDVYIRYWDPRAIEIILEMWSDEDREKWFKTVDIVYSRDPFKKDILLQFTLDGKQTISLKEDLKS